LVDTIEKTPNMSMELDSQNLNQLNDMSIMNMESDAEETEDPSSEKRKQKRLQLDAQNMNNQG